MCGRSDVEREGDRVAVGDEPGAWEDGPRVAVGVPADVVDVQVGQEDRCRRPPAPTPASASAGSSPPPSSASSPRARLGPTPVSTRIVRPPTARGSTCSEAATASRRRAPGSARGTAPSRRGRERAPRARRAGRPRRRAARARCSDHHRTRARRRLAVRLLPRDDRVPQHADPLDLGLDHVARLEVERGRVLGEPGDARHRAGREDVARASTRAPSSARGSPGSSRSCGPSASVWRDSPFTRSSIARSCGSGISSGRHDPRPERAEGVDRLAEAEDAGAHLAPLDVARGDVVEDHVAADVVRRLLGREPLARPSAARPRARARSRAPRSGAPGRRPARPARRSRRRSGRRRSTARSRATSRRVFDSSSCSRKLPAVWKNFFGTIGARRRASASGTRSPVSSAPPRSNQSRIVGTSSSTISSPSMRPTLPSSKVTSFMPHSADLPGPPARRPRPMRTSPSISRFSPYSGSGSPEEVP